MLSPVLQTQSPLPTAAASLDLSKPPGATVADTHEPVMRPPNRVPRSLERMRAYPARVQQALAGRATPAIIAWPQQALDQDRTPLVELEDIAARPSTEPSRLSLCTNISFAKSKYVAESSSCKECNKRMVNAMWS